jgi:short-subunit dehydrogenase
MTSDQTALITGASSGIGKALSLQFAKNKFSLVLVARRKDLLEKTAQECQTLSGKPALAVVEDLLDPDAAMKIFRCVHDQGIKIDILVNNAGFGDWNPFVESNIATNRNLIQIHIQSVLELTRFLLPGMVERGFGRVLNVSSVYAYSPVPQQAVYAASKSFFLSFSSALRTELYGTGVSVSTLCPGITDTEFRKEKKTKKMNKFLGMTADRVAIAAYEGLLREKSVIIPGIINRAYVFFCKCFPSQLLGSFTRFVNTHIRGIHSKK